MAEQSLSQITPTGNANEYIQFVERDDHTPTVSSLKVAEHFGKKHQHILRAIEELLPQIPDNLRQSNFGQSFRDVETGNGTIRKFRYYLLTRDAFSLLVMGFTGADAVRWKIRYIEAFNWMEAQLRANAEQETTHRLELAREAGYQQGRDEALSLPAVQAERKTGYLEGLQEGRRLQKQQDGLAQLRRIAAYLTKGLSYADIGKLIGVSKSAVARRVQAARKLGVTL